MKTKSHDIDETFPIFEYMTGKKINSLDLSSDQLSRLAMCALEWGNLTLFLELDKDPRCDTVTFAGFVDEYWMKRWYKNTTDWIMWSGTTSEHELRRKVSERFDLSVHKQRRTKRRATIILCLRTKLGKLGKDVIKIITMFAIPEKKK